MGTADFHQIQARQVSTEAGTLAAASQQPFQAPLCPVEKHLCVSPVIVPGLWGGEGCSLHYTKDVSRHTGSLI